MAQSRDLKESLAGYETRAEALSQQIEEEQARTQEIEDLKQQIIDGSLVIPVIETPTT